MPRRKQPAIPDELLDQLLGGSDPRAALADGGLLDGLKMALAERGGHAELDHARATGALSARHNPCAARARRRGPTRRSPSGRPTPSSTTIPRPASRTGAPTAATATAPR